MELFGDVSDLRLEAGPRTEVAGPDVFFLAHHWEEIRIVLRQRRVDIFCRLHILGRRAHAHFNSADIGVDKTDEVFDLLVVCLRICEAIFAAPRKNDMPPIRLLNDLIILQACKHFLDEGSRPIVSVVLDAELAVGDERVERLPRRVLRVHIHELAVHRAAGAGDQARPYAVLGVRPPQEVDLVSIILAVLRILAEVLVPSGEEVCLIPQLGVESGHRGGAARSLHVPGDGWDFVKLLLEELPTQHQVVNFVLVGRRRLFDLRPSAVDNLQLTVLY